MNYTLHKQQSGAALVIALILLVALSLMAISSMNTASLDLIMAGNEQYRSRAFVAAETGIERAFVSNNFNSATDYILPSATGSGIGNDTYTYTITRPNNGNYDPPPAGYSKGKGDAGFSSIYFRVTAQGVSERGTNAQTLQELYTVVKSGDSETCDTTLTSCDLGS